MSREVELADFAAVIERRFGLLPDGSRQAELTRTLEARMRAGGMTDYARYRALLEHSAEEWLALAPLLTVPETYFFRLPDQLEALAGEVIPAFLKQAAPAAGLRILSAGCASGEEAYSIRILLNERFQQLSTYARGGPGERLPVTIDGFDISLSALERARAGEYNEWSLRATSDERRRDNFFAQKTADKAATKPARPLSYLLLPAARAGVSFRQVNLLDGAAPGDARYDVIFCRNVLIYFTERAVKQAIARLTERLVPGGYLFLGPAESLRGLSPDFTLLQTHDVFYYQLGVGANKAHAAARTASRAGKVGTRRALTLAAALPAAEPLGEGETWYESIGTLGSRLNTIIPKDAAGKRPAAAAKRAPAKLKVDQISATGQQQELQQQQQDVQQQQQDEQQLGFLDLIAAGRFREALAQLDGERAGPLPAEVPVVRAAMLVHLGRFEEAERECTLRLEQGQPDAAAHYLAGLCREHAGDAAEAERQMTQASYLDPGFALPLLRRGMLASRRGDTAGALSAFTRALKALGREDTARLTVFAGSATPAELRELCRTEINRLSASGRERAGKP